MILVARGLTRSFGARVALAPTDLALAPGDALGLLGPNGAGKSTLLALCAGLRLPSAGEVRIDGHPARSPAARARLGVLPERLALPPHATLRELLAAVRPGPAPTIDALDAGAFTDRPIGALSAGQKQRAGLALALHGEPALLLLDEPLTALDADGAALAVEAVDARRRAGCAVLLATHRPDAWIGALTALASLDGGIFRSLGPVGSALAQIPRDGLALRDGALVPAPAGELVAVRWGRSP